MKYKKLKIFALVISLWILLASLAPIIVSFSLEKLIFASSVHYYIAEYFNHSLCLESPIYMH
jgi:hypothetical protein